MTNAWWMVAVAVGLADPAAAQQAAPDKRGYSIVDPTPDAQLREFNTDRPDTTESPYTVDAGHVQIELSFAEYATSRDAGVREHTLDVAPVNLKVGLLNTVDLQLVFTPYERIESGGSVVDGFGDDTQVRLKVNLWGDDGGKTAFALLPFVKLPTGSPGLGNGHVEGGLILPLAVDLPADFKLATMAEFDWVYNEDRDDYGIDVVHSASLGHPIAGKLEGYLEYVGNAPRAGGGGYRAIASSGVTYQLGDNWAVDAGGTVGLAGRVDDVRVFAGTSIRF